MSCPMLMSGFEVTHMATGRYTGVEGEPGQMFYQAALYVLGEKPGSGLISNRRDDPQRVAMQQLANEFLNGVPEVELKPVPEQDQLRILSLRFDRKSVEQTLQPWPLVRVHELMTSSFEQ